MQIKILGKLIGAILGYMIGGPFGLVCGFLLGHTFDVGYWQSFKKSCTTPQEIFFRATFIVMGNIAKADGQISSDEIAYARAVMQQMQLNDLQQQRAIQYFNLGKQANFDYVAVINELKKACQKYPALLHLFMEIQLQIAHVDQCLNGAEKNILMYLCQQLDFNPQEFRQFNFANEKSAPDLTANLSYQILKISPTANDREVTYAYRRMLQQYHPDKLVAKGLPEEMMQFATQKTQEIKAAYKEICKIRGIN